MNPSWFRQITLFGELFYEYRLPVPRTGEIVPGTVYLVMSNGTGTSRRENETRDNYKNWSLQSKSKCKKLPKLEQMIHLIQ